MADHPQPASSARAGEALRAMFAARKQVFIDLLKWDLPALAGQYEVDQFDDADARYLILMDDHGHRASTRLLRTDRAHLLGELFPFLCNGALPAGPATREITRFCLDHRQRAPARRAARNQLVTALAEFALRSGITDYVGVATLSWFNQIQTFGWRCAALGAPVRVGADMLVALHIRIDERTVPGLRAAEVYAPPTMHLIEEATIACVDVEAAAASRDGRRAAA